MANSLFDKIMGKVPVIEVPEEEELQSAAESEEETEAARANATAESKAESEEETEAASANASTSAAEVEEETEAASANATAESKAESEEETEAASANASTSAAEVEEETEATNASTNASTSAAEVEEETEATNASTTAGTSAAEVEEEVKEASEATSAETEVEEEPKEASEATSAETEVEEEPKEASEATSVEAEAEEEPKEAPETESNASVAATRFAPKISHHELKKDADISSDLLNKKTMRNHMAGSHSRTTSGSRTPQEDLAENPIEPTGDICYIDIVLDTTYSMARIYRVLYDKIFTLINSIYRESKKPGEKVEVRFGLTYIREDRPEIEETFSINGFTRNVAGIMDCMKQLTLKGGAVDGHENINDAIRTSLHKLSEAGRDNDHLGMLLFTDSIPGENALVPTFDTPEAIAFAYIFAYDDLDYIPVMEPGSDGGTKAFSAEVSKLERFLNTPNDEIEKMGRERIWNGMKTA